MLELTEEHKAQRFELKIVVLSLFEDQAHVSGFHPVALCIFSIHE